jgi:hypothetical protein
MVSRRSARRPCDQLVRQQHGGSADGGKTGNAKGGNIDVSSKTVGGDASQARRKAATAARVGSASSPCRRIRSGGGAANNGSAASQGERGRGNVSNNSGRKITDGKAGTK